MMAEDCTRPKPRQRGRRRVVKVQDETQDHEQASGNYKSGGAYEGGKSSSGGYDDEDMAEEIADLQTRGILPKDFTYSGKDGLRRGSFDSEDLIEEINGSLSIGANSSKVKDGSTSDIDTDILMRTSEIVPEIGANGLPENWCMDMHKKEHYKLFPLRKGDKEYDVVDQDFADVGIEVTGIERLQNTRLLKKFKDEIEDLKIHSTDDYDVNVQYLYHGTGVEKVRLCEEGLDQRLSRMGYFGKGIYFSDTPLKCVHYADDPGRPNPDEAYILKCRVILGDIKVYPKFKDDKELRREPEKETITHGLKKYDSVAGCPKDYNEYVVYDNRRAMIEYIIKFKANKELMKKLRTQPVATAAATMATKTSRRSLTPSFSKPRKSSGKETSDEVGEATFDNEIGEVTLEDEVGEATPDDEIGEVTYDAAEWAEIEPEQITSTRYRNEAFCGPPVSEEDHYERIMEVRQAVRKKRLQETEGHGHSSVPPIYDPDTVWEITETSYQDNQNMSSGPYHPSGFALATLGSNFSDPSVSQALDMCIIEFLAVTQTDDSNRARYYVQRAEMDVNRAISLYYEEGC
ncbi:uncharacterized protein LOC128238565 isoform X1 [Mya arenaria]|uniref:uncharacterized protein LOC128238565 isoform X1 n=1 Tax=Mya arenaria TaxID=6604 RepID=UPI0022DEA7C3|nr:uncharacterized protein LOC128238565 isoform X1 [Mya arenaria]XP_052810586.1 uncharacterized protein LOC128238565 isoform X1 [Mya arenaria]